MTILETINGIIEYEEGEQKLRKESLIFKNKEIQKYKNYIGKIEKRKIEIEKEIKESDMQIIELKKIKKQLERAICGVSE